MDRLSAYVSGQPTKVRDGDLRMGATGTVDNLSRRLDEVGEEERSVVVFEKVAAYSYREEKEEELDLQVSARDGIRTIVLGFIEPSSSMLRKFLSVSSDERCAS